MLDNQDVKSETSIHDVAIEGLQFSMEVYKDVVEKNKSLADENVRLRLQLQSVATPVYNDYNIYSVIIWFGTLGAIWHIVNQLINK